MKEKQQENVISDFVASVSQDHPSVPESASQQDFDDII